MEKENKQEAENMSAIGNDTATLKDKVERLSRKYENLQEGLSKVQIVVTKISRKQEEAPRPLPKPLGKYFYLATLGCILAGAVVFFALAVLMKRYFYFCISDDSIVVTLIGILATFVVVDHYAQVKQVKDEFEGIEEWLAQRSEKKIKEVEKETRKDIEQMNHNIIEEWMKDNDMAERIERLEELVKGKVEQAINDEKNMKKVILLLLWSLVGTVTAQVYHEHDKEKLRNYFKQAAALEGIPKGEVLEVTNGLVLEVHSDYVETWETDEEWVGTIRGLTWTESIPKRIAGVEWSLIRRSFVYNSYALSGSLDLSGCTGLTSLFIDQSQLAELNVSGCTSLTSLKCNLNLLTFLNVNGCTALQTLVCAANQLTGLDVSSCTSLITLFCAGNCLTAVDIRNNTKLENLDVDGNPLTTLDVSKNLLLVNVMDMNTPSLTDVIVGWSAPPAIFDGSGVHSFPIRSEGTLHVPVGSVPLYAAAYPWREFGKIVEYTTPSPNSNNAAEQPVRVWSQGNTVFISTPNQGQSLNVYSLNGSLLRHVTLDNYHSFTLPTGVYLVKVNNLVTKIIIK